MRIVLVGAGTQNNATYRAFLPAVALAERGHQIAVVRGNEAEIRHELRVGRFDLAQIYRNHTAQAQRIARDLRADGVAVAWDNDDELTDCPSDAFLARRRGGLRAQRAEAGMRRMIAAADLVTTPSTTLGEVYARWGAARVEVIENYVPVDFVTVERGKKDDDGVVVGWVAGGEHEYDARALGLRTVLRRLLDTHPDVRVRMLGVDLGLGHERASHVPNVHFTALHRWNARLDIGIAPLSDIPFNRARSNVKLKEYAGAGVPWLASPVGPYLGLGEREGGRLVPADRWFEELDRLVRDARARRKLAKAGRRWAQKQTIDANAQRWEAAFADAITRARARSPDGAPVSSR